MQEASTAKHFSNCVSNFEIVICYEICHKESLITSPVHNFRYYREQFLLRDNDSGAPSVVNPGHTRTHLEKKRKVAREKSQKGTIFNHSDVKSSLWSSGGGAAMNSAVRQRLMPDILAQENGAWQIHMAVS